MNMNDVTPKCADDAAQWALLAVMRIDSLWTRLKNVRATEANQAASLIVAPAEEFFGELAHLHENERLWTALYFADIQCAGLVEPVSSGYGTYAASLFFAIPGFGMEFAGRLANFPASEADAVGQGWGRAAGDVRRLAEAALPAGADEFKEWATKRIVVEHRIVLRSLLRRDGNATISPPEPSRSLGTTSEDLRVRLAIGMRPKVADLLAALWPDDGRSSKEVGQEDLLREVWGMSPISTDTFRKAIDELEEKLGEPARRALAAVSLVRGTKRFTLTVDPAPGQKPGKERI